MENPFIGSGSMPLNIENPEVERLVNEIADLTGEAKTEAVRRALHERRARLRTRVTAQARQERLLRFLGDEVWSRVPEDQIGRPPKRAERERALGYGDEGF